MLYFLYGNFQSLEQTKKLILRIFDSNNKIIIKNENIVKAIFSFDQRNEIITKQSKFINLKGQNIGDEGFQFLANIILDVLILDISYNNISDISLIKSI